MLRQGLGNIIAVASNMTLPKPINRSSVQQKKVDKACENLSIYQFYACPFCIKVRRSVHRLNLKINYINAANPQHKAVLATEGRKVQVPCLYIKDKNQYLYESNDIIDYLNKHFN